MRILELSPQQRYRLRQQRDTTSDAGTLKRSVALLQLDAGRSVAQVADELGVSRQSVYNWLGRYLLSPTPPSLRDRRGHGHVSAFDDDLLAVLSGALGRPPSAWGYRQLEWTVSLLQDHLQRWDGRRWSESTLRRQLHELGYAWKRPRYVLIPDPQRDEKISRIRQQVKGLGPRDVLLFEDETDLLLFPPLRAGWAKRGQPLEVPISGRNARRVVFGAIAVRSGQRLLLARRSQKQGDFQALLELVAWHYKGWRPWLLLDEDSSHTAHASVGLAERLNVGLIWLPKRCPELNGLELLWGHAKDEVTANHQDPDIDHLVASFIRYIQSLAPRQAKRKAGLLSDNFWLNPQCQK